MRPKVISENGLGDGEKKKLGNRDGAEWGEAQTPTRSWREGEKGWADASRSGEGKEKGKMLNRKRKTPAKQTM